jgi:hypothetical protein
MDEVSPEMRDMLEELRFESESDVVKENQVLMHLSHVADVGYYGKTEYLRKKTYRQEFTHAGNSRAIYLDE